MSETRNNTGMNRKDLAIGVLSTTAVILFVGLILVSLQPEPALASGMGDRGGDYIMLVGELRDQEEALYVINTAQNLVIQYRYDIPNRQIVVRSGTDLNKLVNGAQQNQPNQRGRGRGRGRRP